MIKPITRTKRFVQDHKPHIVGAACLVAGVAIGKNLPIEKALAVLDITADQAKQLLDDPSKCIHFETAVENIVVVVKPA